MSQADEAAIRELEHRFNAAWDAHDPERMAESLADDAQFITVNGAWTTTRDGFRDLMAAAAGASGAFRTSTPDAGDAGDVPRARRRDPAFALLDRRRGV